MRTSTANFLLLSLAVSLVAARPSAAQDRPAAKSLDVSFISDEYFAAAVIHPARLIRLPALKDLPLGEMAKSFAAEFGINPAQIEQAIVLFPTGPRPVPVAAILRFNRPHAGEKTLAQISAALKYGDLTAAEHAGKKYFRCTGRVQAAGYVADRQTLIVGSESCVQTMMTTKTAQSPLLERLRKVDTTNDLTVIVMTERITTRFGELRDTSYGRDWAVLDFGNEILKRCQSVILTVGPAASRLGCELEAKDAEAAEFLNDLFRGGAAFAKALLPVWQRQLRKEHWISAGLRADLMKLSEPLAQRLSVRRADNRLIVSLELPKDFAQRAMAIADSWHDSLSIYNLRRLALAMHEYHDVYNRLPAHANYDRDGKPLLSWRVHVLPFVDGPRLHERFKLNEPWDSEHNKRLIPQMPNVYQSPGRTLPAGKTCYLVPVTDDLKYRTVFARGTGKKGEANDGMVTTFGNITDGSAFTLMIVEAAPDKAVIWTKPDDWEFDPKKPKEGLFGMRRHLLVASADASIKAVRKEVPDNILRAVFGCSDSEPLTLGTFVVRDEQDQDR